MRGPRQTSGLAHYGPAWLSQIAFLQSALAKVFFMASKPNASGGRSALNQSLGPRVCLVRDEPTVKGYMIIVAIGHRGPAAFRLFHFATDPAAITFDHDVPVIDRQNAIRSI